EKIEDRSEVAGVRESDPLASECHVLLRHGLLLQAGGREGAGAVPGEEEPKHASIANVHDVRGRLVDLCTADFALADTTGEHERSLVVERPGLLRAPPPAPPRATPARARHALRKSRWSSATAASPDIRPGSGPSMLTHSISGSAHSP